MLRWRSKSVPSFSQLATELADAVKRHWLTQGQRAPIGNGLYWASNRLSSMSKVEGTTETDNPQITTSVPNQEVTPLSLRGRFREQMSFTFASEVLRRFNTNSNRATIVAGHLFWQTTPN